MIGILGEKYIGREKYGITDVEIFENLKLDFDKKDLPKKCLNTKEKNLQKLEYSVRR
jgi:hypothetical protein